MAGIDTIAGLLAKAESTDSEQEAELLVEKAKFLADKESISLEIARQHQKDKTKRKAPIQKVIEIGRKGERGIGRYLELFGAIVDNNDVKWETNGTSMASIRVFGFEPDIEVSEMLFNFLVVQMVELGKQHVDKEEWSEERYWDNHRGEYRPVTRKLALDSFYQRFSDRIGERLRQVKMNAESEKYTVTDEQGNEKQTTGAMVLVDKKKNVQSYFRENSSVTGLLNTRKEVVSRISGRAGASAGNSAKLKADVQIGGQRTAIE